MPATNSRLHRHPHSARVLTIVQRPKWTKEAKFVLRQGEEIVHEIVPG